MAKSNSNWAPPFGRCSNRRLLFWFVVPHLLFCQSLSLNRSRLHRRPSRSFLYTHTHTFHFISTWLYMLFCGSKRRQQVIWCDSCGACSHILSVQRHQTPTSLNCSLHVFGESPSLSYAQPLLVSFAFRMSIRSHRFSFSPSFRFFSFSALARLLPFLFCTYSRLVTLRSLFLFSCFLYTHVRFSNNNLNHIVYISKLKSFFFPNQNTIVFNH